MMEWLRIVATCVCAAVLYGVGHDLVTAHLCPAYFTIGHEPLIASEHPVVLAAVWGAYGTWYVGVVLAIPLGCAARLGESPPRAWRRLIRPIGRLLALMAGCAGLLGGAAWWWADWRGWSLPGALGEMVPRGQHAAFRAAWGSHAASYGVGFLGGLVLPVLVWRAREAEGRRAGAAVVA
jgi:H+/Cl- antiporter ClcA